MLCLQLGVVVLPHINVAEQQSRAEEDAKDLFCVYVLFCCVLFLCFLLYCFVLFLVRSFGRGLGQATRGDWCVCVLLVVGVCVAFLCT